MEFKFIVGLTVAIFSLLCVTGLIVWACLDIGKYPHGRKPYRGGVGRDWK